MCNERTAPMPELAPVTMTVFPSSLLESNTGIVLVFLVVVVVVEVSEELNRFRLKLLDLNGLVSDFKLRLKNRTATHARLTGSIRSVTLMASKCRHRNWFRRDSEGPDEPAALCR